MHARLPIALMAAGLIALNATCAFAQQEPAKPATPATQTHEPKPGSEFPKRVKKSLFATKDLRGEQAPKIEFGTWLNAKPDTKDKVILIDFWATWCPPCRALIPELAGWQEKFKDDLVIIGLSDEKPAMVLEFFKKDTLKYAMAVDEKGTTKKLLDISGIPHVLIIGTDNVVRWQGFPGSPEDKLTEEVVKAIIEADKARRAEEAATKAKKETPAATPPAKPAERPATAPETVPATPTASPPK